MSSFLHLEGKHILVTGATGGIGKQTVISLSEQGARVTFIGRNEVKLRETSEALCGEHHLSVCFDLSETAGLEGMIKSIIEKQGPFDGFVQSAGVSRDQPLNLVKYEKIHEMMLTNFYSFFEIVRVISRKGRYNQGLSIVGISSTASECAVPSNTAYSATKAAMNGAMRSMARELAPKGIRVNTILPGPTNTAMYMNYLSLKAGLDGAESERPPVGLNYLGINEPIDVANAILFLLSPASRQITGIELPVDAGYTSC